MFARADHPVLGEPAPTLLRLYATVRDMVRHSDYSDRTKGEIEAALVNRLELLTDGSLGSCSWGARPPPSTGPLSCPGRRSYSPASSPARARQRC